MKRFIPAALAAAFLAGALAPAAGADGFRIDGSTLQAYSASLRLMQRQVEPEEQAVFALGLMRMVHAGQPALTADEAMAAAPQTMNGIGLEAILDAGRAVHGDWQMGVRPGRAAAR